MSRREASGSAKRGLFRIIFSRSGIFLMMVLMQFGVFVATTFHLREYTFYIYGVFTILRVVVIIYIINRKGNPAFKITWILCVLAFPIVGTMFYVYVEMQVGTSFMQQRLTELKLETVPYMQQDQDVVDAIWASKSANAHLSYFLSNRLNFPTYRNTSVKYFPLGEHKFKYMVHEIGRAHV